MLVCTMNSLMLIHVFLFVLLIQWKLLEIMLQGNVYPNALIIAMRTLILIFVLVIALQLPSFQGHLYSRIRSIGNVFRIAHLKLPMQLKILVLGNALLFAQTKPIQLIFLSIFMR